MKLLIGMDIKEEDKIIQEVTRQEYKEGFVTDVGQDFIPKGLNEDIIRTISRLKEEPEWMLEFRLGAFRKWQKMEMPEWGHLDMPVIDFKTLSTTQPQKRIRNARRRSTRSWRRRSRNLASR